MSGGKGRPVIKVWVTRDEPRPPHSHRSAEGPLSAALRAQGLEPVCEPVVQRRVTGDVTKAVRELGERDWLVLTSAFAVDAVRVGKVRCRVAVVGPASRAAAQKRGLRVERVSPDGTGAGLWASLRADADGAARICHPRSSLAEPAAAWDGVTVNSPVLYETARRAVDAAALGGVDIAAVTSPSAAAAVCEWRPRMRCASIGPSTTAALRAGGAELWVQAPEPTFRALAAGIASKLGL
jgi:uroporphyrinogen-III synthase